jgi:uncharacterized membrane protein (UPF0127 family)
VTLRPAAEGWARRIAGAAAIVLCTTSLAQAGVCAENRVDLRSDAGVVRFAVEIADDPQERSRGLMHRTELAEGAGMLFLFDRPQRQSFWMKNTPLPLDIIFVDARGVVESIAAETTPFSEQPLPSDGPVIAVLEINGGLAERYGIGVGAELRHPAFQDGNPAWPCE